MTEIRYIVRSEWIKLWSVRSTWWCLGAAAVVVPVFGALAASAVDPVEAAALPKAWLAEDGFDPLGTDQLREVRAWVAEQRAGEPFELVVEGVLPSDPAQARDRAAELEAAGVTWWIHSDWDFATVTPRGLMDRIRLGPVPG